MQALAQAYEEGVAACLSGRDDVLCRWQPGTPEYKKFCDGFCHRIEQHPLLLNHNGGPNKKVRP